MSPAEPDAAPEGKEAATADRSGNSRASATWPAVLIIGRILDQTAPIGAVLLEIHAATAIAQ